MGNRAVIQFKGSNLGLYLHWNGGRASVEGMLLAAGDLGIYGDVQMVNARFAQMVGNWFGGKLSVYQDVFSRLDCDNGDNGVYLVDPASMTIIGRRYHRGTEEHNEEKTQSIRMECVAKSIDYFNKE
jgi:hypothetical protein